MLRRVLIAALLRLLALVFVVPPIWAVTAVFLRSAPVAGWPAAQAVTIGCGFIAAAAALAAVIEGVRDEVGK